MGAAMDKKPRARIHKSGGTIGRMAAHRSFHGFGVSLAVWSFESIQFAFEHKHSGEEAQMCQERFFKADVDELA